MKIKHPTPKKKEFPGLRGIFWPIHSFELKKFLPLSLMMACILFNYTILRDVKDVLIVTSCGAEAITFIKLYGTLPFAVLFLTLYSRLSSHLSPTKVFNILIASFALFFVVFGFLLFPLRDTLHMAPETLSALQEAHPRFHFLMALIGHWSYALLYIFSELWGTIGLSILFWQFANGLTRIPEAKRFYPLFSVIGNLGFLSAGSLLVFVTSHFSYLPSIESWEHSLRWIMTAVTISSAFVLFLHRWVEKNVMTDERLYKPNQKTIPTKKEKPKYSFRQNLKTVFQSRYLILMSILVLGYGITINLVEVTWKSQMKLQFPTPCAYAHAMGYFSMVSATSTILLVFIGANILRRLGWFAGAMVTPIIMLSTGILFFSFILFKEALSPWVVSLGTTPLFMAVLVGGIQNILTKGSKYVLFDSTKEMAYIPLPTNLRTQGKAAVDGLGDRLGKSGGGIIQQALLMSIVGATQLSIAPYVAGIFFIVLMVWLYAVKDLNHHFQELSREEEN